MESNHIKKLILDAINTKNEVFIKNAFLINPKWSDFSLIYEKANQTEDMRYISFASMSLNNSEKYTNVFNDVTSVLSQLHPNEKICTMALIHFISKQSEYIDELKDEDGLELRSKFFNNNPEKVPTVIDKGGFNPSIHDDDVDGFYIQYNGSVLWRVYKNKKINEYILNAGDMIFIPKYLKHSVESLCPRTAISVSFEK